MNQYLFPMKVKCFSIYSIFGALVVLLTGVLGCGGEKSDTTLKAPVAFVPSPFSGTWISEDSDPETAFSLSIEHQSDSLFGNFCLVTAGGKRCDCYTPGFLNRQRAFAVVASGETTIETRVGGYRNDSGTGKLRLTVAENKLYWRIEEAPEGKDFTIKQTTFIRDTSFH